MKESIYNDGHVQDKGAAAIATSAHLEREKNDISVVVTIRATLNPIKSPLEKL